ncbi:hypothetical protein OS493_008322 [Desmophyllum pertusum]|uniref:Uncharacterized protein n=1 Tax=Desmophyllum pertusum TaxID=174260 RepID=A0A9X0A3Y9_9CNID|nr:hypothetical protein OS493_008322 [Desmophyllum pertusum]
MKSMITLLFLAAVAVYARAEMEYHPQAILHYLEMEDRDMARKVRSFVKLNDFKPSFRPSIRPSGMPPMPPDVKLCIVKAVLCHKKAGEDACEHLECIKKTGICLHGAGVEPPPFMKKCLPIIPCCLIASETCEEKLCCFVRFGECLGKLGDKKDAM